MKRVGSLVCVCVASAFWACTSPNRSLPGDSAPPTSAQRAPTASQPEAAVPDGPFRLTASIRELMDSEIDPAADFIWASVASISTRAGLEERQPRTDEEWLEVRRHAITLIEATNLLVMDGRRVSHDSSPRRERESSTPIKPSRRSTLTVWPSSRSRSGFGIRGCKPWRRSMPKIRCDYSISAAASMHACESCHVTFWYPNLALPYK